MSSNSVLPLVSLQGLKRRLIYLALYEAIAVGITTVMLALLSGRPVDDAGTAAVVSSAIALAWNQLFNGLFEAWERRQPTKGRSWKRRVAHALGFEGGLVLFIVPAFAWLLDLSLWEALLYDAGLIVFFLFYTFAYNMFFDAVFDLPTSARLPADAQ